MTGRGEKGGHEHGQSDPADQLPQEVQGQLEVQDLRQEVRRDQAEAPEAQVHQASEAPLIFETIAWSNSWVPGLVAVR